MQLRGSRGSGIVPKGSTDTNALGILRCCPSAETGLKSPDCLSADEDEGLSSTNRTRDCAAERVEKLGVFQRTGTREFIPNCRADGSYVPIQCHNSTRSCWCVTETGRPIPGTSVLYTSGSRRPNCAKYHPRAKSATKRRSSQGRKNRKSCNHADRAQFNLALIKTFRGEYGRLKSFSSSFTGYGEMGGEDEVLSWKFDHLDKNKDNFLERNETVILKRLVKQQIQPRQCAKTFISFCANGDKKITKKEWVDCLKIGSMENRSTRGMHPFQLLKQGSSLPHGDFSPPLSPNSRKDSDTREVSNCWTDRQSALASRKSGSNESVIIPECNPSGLYQRTQCAQGKAYCWCVFEETGLQIPLTVVINSTPDCDKKVAAYKSMKGCSGPKKTKFVTDLMATLSKSMQEALSQGKKRLPGDLEHMNPHEQVARWHYNRLDANNNAILERKEWKVFKNETSGDRNLRRCGKKLGRVCDVNQDRKITLTEWLDCLGIKSSEQSQSSSRKPVHRSSSPRTGKNPFTAILKQ
ncbi:unnamed protein product [Allacma fusca]|uniref:Thyroglobulin type-1 domain-containing protein n=1 Tax=Allacma fusca TaxID=39272 RepID=A0A8J2JJR5_9HEXA|nr:unnamed protein product [Allacma fusca]